MKKLFCVLALLLVLPRAGAVSARAAVVIDADTGETLFEQNADSRLPMASTTKIMTMALALEMCEDPANTYVTAPSYIWNEFEGISISHCDIQRGETLTMQDLLYGMALQSANEAANIVADYLGNGSISDFVELMNQKAQEIGAVNTHFVNANVNECCINTW